MSTRTFSWAHGEGEVQTLGGMLGPVRFRLPGGRVVSPLHVAPWADEIAAAALPGILRRLRGEWPCVPFGAARAFRAGEVFTTTLRVAVNAVGP